MADRLRISAKKLGRLAQPSFCPRCFWILNHMNSDVPYSVFPRIFNDIDVYTKRLVHGWFDDEGKAPPWLKALAETTGYVEPPRSSDFQMEVGSNILLTGEADAIFTTSDVRLIIGDYKTAFANPDDPLLPVYRIQLNAYKILAEHLKMGKVKSLALIYTQPMCSDTSARLPENKRSDGFAIGFKCEVVQIPIDTAEVYKLLDKAWDIFSAPNAPLGHKACADCKKREELIRVSAMTVTSVKAYASAFGV